MCKEHKCVQSFIHFLAVTIFFTYAVTILSPSVGFSLSQNNLFSIDIPSFSEGQFNDIRVISMIGLYQIDNGLIVEESNQWTDLQDIHCTDDWIPCTHLHVLRIALYAAVGLSVMCVLFSCCQCHKLFGFTSFLLIICVTGTVLVSTKITSGVADNIHSEEDALTFVCETSGLDYLTKMVFDEDVNHKVAQPSGWKYTLGESGVSIYVSGLLISLCVSSAFVVVSGVVLFVWFFFRALCCCCCPCCSKKSEAPSEVRFIPYEELEPSVNRV